MKAITKNNTQMPGHTSSFFKLVNNPVAFRLFRLKSLPAALFSGLRLQAISEEKCTVSVPYKWFTKNPFRSTYFACLSMAAEMSTGALVLAHAYKRVPAIATLIVAVDSVYHKKAIGNTFFTCADGVIIKKAIEESVQSKEAKIIKTYAKGVNEKGEVVSEFWFTWSVKERT